MQWGLFEIQANPGSPFSRIWWVFVPVQHRPSKSPHCRILKMMNIHSLSIRKHGSMMFFSGSIRITQSLLELCVFSLCPLRSESFGSEQVYKMFYPFVSSYNKCFLERNIDTTTFQTIFKNIINSTLDIHNELILRDFCDEDQ